jgi:hypothetical protein
MTVRTVLACAFALLVVSSGSLVLINNGTISAAPDGIKDRATFTVRTGAIYPHAAEGGQICAEKIKPDVNRVIVTNATIKKVDIYLGDEGEVQAHISFPTGEVNGQLVLYTNGENLLVNTLATLGICLPPGVPNPLPTTLEAYYLGDQNLETTGLDLSSGGNVPEPSGPSFSQLLNTTNTSREELGLNNSTTSTNTTNSTNVINGTSNNSTVEENANKTTSTPINNSIITPGNETNTTNSTTITETPSETVTPVTTTATPSPNETETNSTATSTPQTIGDTNNTNNQTSPTATPSPTITPTATPTITTTTPTTTNTILDNGTPTATEALESSPNETVDSVTNTGPNTTNSVPNTVDNTTSGTIDRAIDSTTTTTNEVADLITNITNTTTVSDGSDSEGGVLDISGTVDAWSRRKTV